MTRTGEREIGAVSGRVSMYAMSLHCLSFHCLKRAPQAWRNQSDSDEVDYE